MIRALLEGKPLRQPIHPMLVHAPIGLFTLSLVLDIVGYLFPMEGFYTGSYYALVVGIVMSLVAAIPGLVDYSSIRRDHPARGKARWHMGLNFTMVAIFAVDAWVRHEDLYALKAPPLPFALSVVGIVLLSISGYLGGAMIYDDGIGVGRHRRRTRTPEETLGIAMPPQREAGGEHEARWTPVADAEVLHEGETLRVDLGGTVIVVTRVDGEFYAFQKFCTQRFGPLSQGKVEKGTIECPWHRSCFDVRTGEVLHGPAKVALKTFPVAVRDGKICIEVTSVPVRAGVA